MKTNFLFPHRFKAIGWIIFVPAAVIGAVLLISGMDCEPQWLDVKVLSLLPNSVGTFFDNVMRGESPLCEITTTNILDELVGIAIIIGGLLVAFSKERNEDEYIAKIRLESLLWATYVNYGIVILAMLFLFDFTFLNFMIINLFTLIVVFIIRFNFIICRLNRQSNEK